MPIVVNSFWICLYVFLSNIINMSIKLGEKLSDARDFYILQSESDALVRWAPDTLDLLSDANLMFNLFIAIKHQILVELSILDVDLYEKLTEKGVSYDLSSRENLWKINLIWVIDAIESKNRLLLVNVFDVDQDSHVRWAIANLKTRIMRNNYEITNEYNFAMKDLQSSEWENS